jgi:outer membrane protein TolC
LLGYESAILKAYQEVEDSLVNFASSEMSRRNFQSARDDSLQSLMLSSSAYENGVEDVQSVIASELQFIQMEFQLTEQESAVAMAAVALYKSTGGDWSPVMPSADGPVPIKSKTSQSVADANSGGTS